MRSQLKFKNKRFVREKSSEFLGHTETWGPEKNKFSSHLENGSRHQFSFPSHSCSWLPQYLRNLHIICFSKPNTAACSSWQRSPERQQQGQEAKFCVCLHRKRLAVTRANKERSRELIQGFIGKTKMKGGLVEAHHRHTKQTRILMLKKSRRISWVRSSLIF